jgi:hypothetical protein
MNDFNWLQYLLNYEDLQKAGLFSKEKLYTHYINYGIKEKRTDKVIVEFNWLEYLKKYEDLKLAGINTEEKTILHYILYGRNEGRFSNFKLPKDFNANHYKIINFDLKNLNEQQLITHYLNYGQKENRIYYILHYIPTDLNIDNNLINNCIFLVNHASSLTGAPIFLYDFAVYLLENNIFKNIILIDVFQNEKLFSIYKNKIPKIIYCYNDTKIILKLIKLYNPLFIYSNSESIIALENSIFNDYNFKIIYHFHETRSNYQKNPRFPPLKNNINLNNNLVYVVSDNILNDYKKSFNFKNLSLFPPFIPTNKLDNLKLLNLEEIESCSTNLEEINKKITFCMIGQKIDRKGYNIFINVAKELPNYNFLWIGDNLDNTNFPNYYQIEHTTNPYKYSKFIDYLLVLSKEDPCPIILLEAMSLGIPCIVLDKNITYEHKVENYYIIKNHNNNYKNIVNFINSMKLEKNSRFSNLSEYILNNFTKPYILNKTNEKTILLQLSLYNITDFAYYYNLINLIKIINNNNVFVLLCVNTGKEFNNNMEYKTFDEKGNLYFGIDNLNISDFSNYFNLPHDLIIFTPNKGYDIGGLLIGLNYLKNKFNNFIYLHSKTNDLWREQLFKICLKPITSEYDTIICKNFVDTFDKNDLNFKILEDLQDILPLPNNKQFSYIGGTVFSTKTENLNILIENFNKIFPLLTDINKDDIYWRSIMTNKQFFSKYYERYKNCIYNKPIDLNSHEKMIETNSKNFIELTKNGYRGIPDCQIEHALERYIGFLILYNKKLSLV